MKRDLDVENMTLVQLKDEVMKLRGVLRPIATATGHGLCHWWPEVRKALPELQGAPEPVPPPTCEFLLQCAVFRATLSDVGALYALTAAGPLHVVGTRERLCELRRLTAMKDVQAVRLSDGQPVDIWHFTPLAGKPHEPLPDLQLPRDVQELPGPT